MDPHIAPVNFKNTNSTVAHFVDSIVFFQKFAVIFRSRFGETSLRREASGANHALSTRPETHSRDAIAAAARGASSRVDGASGRRDVCSMARRPTRRFSTKAPLPRRVAYLVLEHEPPPH